MYIYLSRKIKVSAVFVMALTVFIYSYGTSDTFFMLLASFVHEFGHISASLLCGAKTEEILIGFGGADIKKAGITSYKEDILIFFGGIFANVLSFLLFPKTPFGTYSLAYAVLNAVPAETLDGGRVIYSLLYPHFERRAEIFCRILSFISLFVLWQMSVYILFKTGENFSLFLFCLCLFASVTDEEHGQ